MQDVLPNARVATIVGEAHGFLAGAVRRFEENRPEMVLAHLKSARERVARLPADMSDRFGMKTIDQAVDDFLCARDDVCLLHARQARDDIGRLIGHVADDAPDR